MVEWLMQAFDVATSEVGSCIVPALVVVPEQSEELKSSHEYTFWPGFVNDTIAVGRVRRPNVAADRRT